MSNPLIALNELLNEDVTKTNQLIVDKMYSPVELIQQLSGYIIMNSGKRLRPLLTLAIAKIFDYQGDYHHKLAGCVEFIHTATLLHDDVVDESATRRGTETASVVWGNKPSVLVGDFLFTRSFELMVECNSLEVMGILSKASALIAQGEVLQLMFTNDIEISYEDYLEVIKSKTAVLFAAATQVGAVIAETTPEKIQQAYEYGMNLGIAFQISDDILDYVGDEKQTGKNTGDDFKEGKVTLPILYCISQAKAHKNQEELEFFKRTFGELDIHDNDWQRVQEIIQKYDAINYSIKEAHVWVEKAHGNLSLLPDHEVKTHLGDLLDFVVNRSK